MKMIFHIAYLQVILFFLGDVGRPDLAQKSLSISKEELGGNFIRFYSKTGFQFYLMIY